MMNNRCYMDILFCHHVKFYIEFEMELVLLIYDKDRMKNKILIRMNDLLQHESQLDQLNNWNKKGIFMKNVGVLVLPLRNQSS
jgi:hypothetical protein